MRGVFESGWGGFMELKGKKIIILVEDRYQILELWYPLIRMREAGARVVTVGPEKGRTYRSERGMEVTADEAAAGIDVGDCDAVIVPGGYSVMQAGCWRRRTLFAAAESPVSSA
jgi:putative intracellular protease/amidase